MAIPPPNFPNPGLVFTPIQPITLDGNDLNNTLNAGQIDPNAAYIIHGKGGDDTMSGGNLNDTLDGGTGNDTMYGGGGNDLFIGGAGSDTMFGGDGIDTVSYANSTSGVALSLLAS